MVHKFTIAMPSKGAIAEPTQSFLKNCGLKVSKPNSRQYTGTMPTIPTLGVLFQRVKDVMYKVSDGTAHLGITGLDVVYEHPSEHTIVIHDALGYGHCQLVIAVPEAWVDVETMDDLIDVALDFRENKGRNIRIATTYTHSTREFLHRHGIHHFTLVKADGAIEAAPTIGYADIIVDLTQTGTTLRENHLKTITGGTLIDAQACLIGNKHALRANSELLEATRILTEYIDAYQNGAGYHQITVDVQGETAEEVAQKIASKIITRGLLGPTIAPIYSPHRAAEADAAWFTVTLTVSDKHMLKAVEHVRAMGGRHVITTPVRYIFLEQSSTYATLLDRLDISN
jgi:ATP phosphoribosyltransferase